MIIMLTSSLHSMQLSKLACLNGCHSNTAAPSTVDGHHRGSVECAVGQPSEGVHVGAYANISRYGDRSAAIDTDIVAGSSGNRCPGHCYLVWVDAHQ